MKKINTLFMSLAVASTVFINQSNAQSSCAWAKTAGGINDDAGTAVATDANGNVYYLGNFYSQSIVIGGTTLHNQAFAAFNYGAEIFLAKYDSCGTLIWAKQAGGKYDAHGISITTDAAGNVYIGGYSNCDTLFLGTTTYINVGGSTNAFVAKYNSSGVAQWVKGAGGNAQNYTQGIALDGSNNVYITGYFNSDTLKISSLILKNGYSGNFGDIFTAKFDNTGAVQWLVGGEGNSQDAGYGIGTDAAGNVYVGGMFGSPYIRFGTDSLINNGFNDIFVVKYNAVGSVQWLRTAGGTDDDQAFGLASDASGNVYITGQIGASSVSFGTQIITNSSVNSLTTFLTKYDNTGTALWARGGICDAFSYNVGNHVTLDAGGNPNIIGYYSSDSLKLGAVTLHNAWMGDSTYDIFAAKYKSNGNLSWARTAGGTGKDYGYGIATGPNKSVYICGEFMSPTISLAATTFSLAAGSLAGDGDAFIDNNISASLLTPNICLVSDDSIVGANQYNVVYWNKMGYSNAATFVIYREVSTNTFKAIGSKPYSGALSEFVDTARSIGPANGDPQIGSYRYCLQIIDTAGTYSQLSPFHNTVYIQNNLGTFSWNLYAVGNATYTPIANFELMRDDNNTGAWHNIGIVAGNQTTLNDPNYSTYQATANWRVDADSFNCSPTLRLSGNNSTYAARVKSHSNTNNNRQAGIEQFRIQNLEFRIWPNPTNSILNVELGNASSAKPIQNGATELQVTDVLGNILIHNSEIKNQKCVLDVSGLPEGVYNISIIGSETVVNKKVVIVK